MDDANTMQSQPAVSPQPASTTQPTSKKPLPIATIAGIIIVLIILAAIYTAFSGRPAQSTQTTSSNNAATTAQTTQAVQSNTANYYLNKTQAVSILGSGGNYSTTLNGTNIYTTTYSTSYGYLTDVVYVSNSSQAAYAAQLANETGPFGYMNKTAMEGSNSTYYNVHILYNETSGGMTYSYSSYDVNNSNPLGNYSKQANLVILGKKNNAVVFITIVNNTIPTSTGIPTASYVASILAKDLP